MKNRNWLAYLVILILVISLANLAFNLKFVAEFIKDKQEVRPTTISGVVPGPADSNPTAAGIPESTPSAEATQSGSLLGAMETTPTKPAVNYSSALTAEEPQFCQWPNTPQYFATALVDPSKQIITLNETRTAKTYKLLKTQSWVYIWEQSSKTGYKFNPKDMALFIEYAKTNQLEAAITQLTDLATAAAPPTCEPSEVAQDAFNLPPTVGFEQVPSQE